MMKMMGKVKEMQERMKVAQENLAGLRATGESGAGLVKAMVSGKKTLVSLEIDPSLLRKEDQTILQDLIIAAVNRANEQAELMAREEMKKTTDGILPNIPGLDLNGLMG